MRVLLVGGGGREHALAWKLCQSPLLKKLYCAPGNAGIASLAECVETPSAGDITALKEWALRNRIDLTVVGPEAPLVNGLADEFTRAGLHVFGPGSAGARLEGSKVWAKEQMKSWDIPTAGFAVFDRYEAALRHLDSLGDGPVVIKADGLAAGKGVTVAGTIDEAAAAMRASMVDGVFGPAGNRVIIEDFLSGEEVSVLAITDGKELLMLPSSQDHKAAGEGDSGPNTGGMGAYSPAPVLTPELASAVREKVFQPLLAGLASLGIEYRGVVYAGLMVSGTAFNVLEFNVRFGDPEAQAILPRLKFDLLPLLFAAAEGRMHGMEMQLHDNAAVCVVLASGGYPGAYEMGKVIHGLDGLARDGGGARGLAVFHAGTVFRGNDIVTNGGRILGVTAWDRELSQALAKAYQAVERISFAGCHYRRDIAYRAINR